MNAAGYVVVRRHKRTIMTNLQIYLYQHQYCITCLSQPWYNSESQHNLHLLNSQPNLLLASRNLLQNLLLQALWLFGTRPASLDLPIPSHKKLLKVPLHARQAQKPRLLFLQPLVSWIRAVAVDVDFAENRKRHAVVYLAEGLDFIVCCRRVSLAIVAE
jgi:hypothetical protein